MSYLGKFESKHSVTFDNPKCKDDKITINGILSIYPHAKKWTGIESNVRRFAGGFVDDLTTEGTLISVEKTMLNMDVAVKYKGKKYGLQKISNHNIDFMCFYLLMFIRNKNKGPFSVRGQSARAFGMVSNVKTTPFTRLRGFVSDEVELRSHGFRFYL